MQPGSRSGDRTRLLGIYRLVALLVYRVPARRAPDIRRQRDFSVLFYKSLKILFRKKAYTPLTGPRHFHPFAPKFIRKINAPADFLFLAAFTQDLPDFSLSRDASNEEEFGFSARRLLSAQAGRDNPGVVTDQHTVFGQQAEQVRKPMMREGSVASPNVQQAGLIALFCRLLSD